MSDAEGGGGVTQAAARPSPRAGSTLQKTGLLLCGAEGADIVIFGSPLSDAETAAVAEMAGASGADRPGARKVEGAFLVRIPLGGERAHVWRVETDRTISAANIKALSVESAAIAGGGGARPVTSAPKPDMVVAALSRLPKARGRKRARLALTAISDATGWSQLARVDMRGGKARRVAYIDQFEPGKTPSIKIFATSLAASEARVFVSSAQTDDKESALDPTEVAAYRETSDVPNFAIALPEGDGPALYAEGEMSAEAMESARAAYALATGEGRKQAARPIRSVIMFAAVVGLLIFLALPTRFEISAPGRLEPAVSEMIVAPYEARLISLSARVGDRVAADAPLAEMSSTELTEAEKRAALDGMLEQLAAQEALASGEYAKYQLAEQRSAIAAFRAEQSARRLEDLTLKAPAAGTVAFIAPDSKVGELLRAGEPVAEVQYGEDMRVRLTIAGADASLVGEGMTGSIVITGLVDDVYPVRVLDDPILIAREGAEPSLSVLAEIDAPEGHQLLKGLSGFARLEAGEAPRAWIYARPLINYVRFALWRYLGLRL